MKEINWKIDWNIIWQFFTITTNHLRQCHPINKWLLIIGRRQLKSWKRRNNSLNNKNKLNSNNLIKNNLMNSNNKRRHQKSSRILNKFLKRKSLHIKPCHLKNLNLYLMKSQKPTKSLVRKLDTQSWKVIRTLITMPEYWLKDLTVWFKMKMLLLTMTNSHSFFRNCHFICTKTSNGRTCTKSNPNLESLRKKEKLKKIREESKRKNKKDWRKFKANVANQSQSQLLDKKRRIFSVGLVTLIASKSKSKEKIKSSLKRLKSKRKKKKMMMTISCDCIFYSFIKFLIFWFKLN